jgi:hypothetical protein
MSYSNGGFSVQLDGSAANSKTLASYSDPNKISDESRNIVGWAVKEAVTGVLVHALSYACPACGIAVNAVMCFDDLMGLLLQREADQRKLQSSTGPFLGIQFEIPVPVDQDFATLYRHILHESVLSGELNNLISINM